MPTRLKIGKDMVALEAPWWGNPIVAGVFAFFGVLLAQGVGLYSARRAERIADQKRWHDDRRKVYVDFLGVVREIQHTDDLPRDADAQKEFAGIFERCDRLYLEVELLGAQSTVQKAHDVYEHAMNLWLLPEKLKQHEGVLRDALSESQILLTEQIRIELGIVKAPRGSVVLNATEPFAILKEASVVALNIQRGTFGGVIGLPVSILFILGQQIAVLIVTIGQLFANMAKTVINAVWRRK